MILHPQDALIHIFLALILSHTISPNPQSFSKDFGITDWNSAMEEEYSSFMKNNTWDLVSLLKEIRMV